MSRLGRHWRLIMTALPLLLLVVWILPGLRTGRRTVAPVERHGFAMGTYVRFVIYDQKGGEVVDSCLAELARLESVFDRFLSESEISRLNARAGAGWLEVSEDLFRVLEVALDVAERSGGALDPSVAPLVDLWGFGEQDGQIPEYPPPSDEEISRLRPRVDYGRIELDPSRRRVRLPQGMQLDLGAVAKGYALDCLVALAERLGVPAALFDLGGNIRVMGTKPDGSAWRIALRHPRRLDDVFAVLSLSEQAVATSGDYQRYFMWDGERYSHLLDPRTGHPASEVCSVTVVAPTGVLSDALSTAAFVLGPEKGRALLESIPGVEGVFVDQDMQMTVTSGLEGLSASL
ncbi:MAG: FAD:protein FMN transferase [Firmicutes bacterium]|nr:FAD:protein FMN transferase [Bacillota bacterium]